MPRKTQPQQPSEVVPQEATPDDITDTPKVPASPVTKAPSKTYRKVVLPSGRIIETF